MACLELQTLLQDFFSKNASNNPPHSSSTQPNSDIPIGVAVQNLAPNLKKRNRSEDAAPPGKRRRCLSSSNIPFKRKTLAPNSLVVTFGGDMNHGNIATWTPEERASGRRLIQFSVSREGCSVTLLPQVVAAAAYDHGTFVISYISDEDYSNQCVVTSVDLLRLCEFAIGTEFSTQENNRVRRNLQSAKPITITKDKHNPFFTRIMRYPSPRPRNIEKDIKVFPCGDLPNLVAKISSQYEGVFPSLNNITLPIASCATILDQPVQPLIQHSPISPRTSFVPPATPSRYSMVSGTKTLPYSLPYFIPSSSVPQTPQYDYAADPMMSTPCLDTVPRHLQSWEPIKESLLADAETLKIMEMCFSRSLAGVESAPQDLTTIPTGPFLVLGDFLHE